MKHRNVVRPLVLMIILLFSMLLSINAQEDLTVIADGLTNPRNMSYDSEGNLYVALAGDAGTLIADSGDEYGATGQVVQIGEDGSVDVLVRGLISIPAGSPRGVHDVQVTDESIWIVLGDTSDLSIPFTHALVELDRETRRVKTWVDLLGLELAEDPDGNPNGESNGVDFDIADDGSILIANASCNCLMQWTRDAGLSIVAAWPHETDNPVPTSVEVGPDGDIYVGFLTGFPFPEGGARIERWSNGELAETFDGLTAVSGLLVTDDGTIYASEYGVFNQGWGPGRVVTVSADGITPVLENVTQPFGLVQAPDGSILVALGAAAGEGQGSIVVLPGTGM